MNSKNAEIIKFTEDISMIDISTLKERRLALKLTKYMVSKLTGLPRQTILYAERNNNITVKTYNILDKFYSKMEEQQ